MNECKPLLVGKWMGVPNAKLMAELEEADAGGKAEKRVKVGRCRLTLSNPR